MLDVANDAYVNDVAIAIRGDRITQIGKRSVGLSMIRAPAPDRDRARSRAR